MENEKPSPCLSCTRVKNPSICTIKSCVDWRAWFLPRWERIYQFGKLYIK